jgi:hypothetical protein
MPLFSGSPSDSIQTLTASPALAVFASMPPTPKQLYAFVGTVTAIDSTAGTLTVNVSASRALTRRRGWPIRIRPCTARTASRRWAS